MSRDRTGAFSDAIEAAAAEEFAADVHYYLTQDPRQLPSRYLYDALGSALFEAICRLPWYRVTRAEERLLHRHGAAILDRAAPLGVIVELGSGSGEKLRLLVDRRSSADPLDVHLVDISPAALAASSQQLAAVPRVRVHTHRSRYEAGLRQATRAIDAHDRALVLLLGSNIGNYDRPGADAFMRTVRSQLRAGDGVLLGADLVKPERELLLAYDDPLGVTAAFNRNLLVRINRELGGDFAVDQYSHRAVWNAGESRIEMHLVAETPQRVAVTAADLRFEMAAGDIIWTESSYKYSPADIDRLLDAAAFEIAEQWIDPDDQFALTLATAV